MCEGEPMMEPVVKEDVPVVEAVMKEDEPMVEPVVTVPSAPPDVLDRGYRVGRRVHSRRRADHCLGAARYQGPGREDCGRRNGGKHELAHVTSSRFLLTHYLLAVHRLPTRVPESSREIHGVERSMKIRGRRKSA